MNPLKTPPPLSVYVTLKCKRGRDMVFKSEIFGARIEKKGITQNNSHAKLNVGPLQTSQHDLIYIFGAFFLICPSRKKILGVNFQKYVTKIALRSGRLSLMNLTQVMISPATLFLYAF